MGVRIRADVREMDVVTASGAVLGRGFVRVGAVN